MEPMSCGYALTTKVDTCLGKSWGGKANVAVTNMAAPTPHVRRRDVAATTKPHVDGISRTNLQRSCDMHVTTVEEIVHALTPDQ